MFRAPDVFSVTSCIGNKNLNGGSPVHFQKVRFVPKKHVHKSKFGESVCTKTQTTSALFLYTFWRYSIWTRVLFQKVNIVSQYITTSEYVNIIDLQWYIVVEM